MAAGKSAHPTMCVVGRLVPHKQVEHAIDAALALRGELPDLRLHVVGSGLVARRAASSTPRRADAGDTVVFEGHVDEVRKQEIYERSWVMALPSLKEGWGLVVGEAGMHGTPTVAYRAAGGTRESIADGESGLLADTQEEFTAALRLLLTDADRRAQLADGARAPQPTVHLGALSGGVRARGASAVGAWRDDGQCSRTTMRLSPVSHSVEP